MRVTWVETKKPWECTHAAIQAGIQGAGNSSRSLPGQEYLEAQREIKIDLQHLCGKICTGSLEHGHQRDHWSTRETISVSLGTHHTCCFYVK